MATTQPSPGAGGAGVEWRLTDAGRQLDANRVRLRPGAAIGEHLEPDLDVLVCVLAGGGRLVVDGEPRQLAPGGLVFLPRGTSRAVTAGPDGLAYLTVHRRRPGMAIGRAEPEGGEAACLLHRVCVECDRLAGEPDARYCARCGAELPS